MKIGVKFVREHRCVRLWATDESGEFPTMEGPALSLQRTRPRRFGVADPQFSTCRGVVLEANHGGERAWLPAKCVVLALGAVPNAEVFSSLDRAADGSILVDGHLRASHPSGDVFAVGDVATFPLPLTKENAVRLPVRSTAETMSAFAAEACAAALSGVPHDAIYDPVPRLCSKVLDLDWEFRGAVAGEVVPLGLDEYPSTKVFGAFWVLDNRVVGGFLEGGSADQRAKLEAVARAAPRVTRVQKFRKLGLDEFLNNPFSLEPPVLLPGEFHAELDPDFIAEAFRRYDLSGDGFAKTSAMGDLMRDLGADWDPDEEAEALRALDPAGDNHVSLEAFAGWWVN